MSTAPHDGSNSPSAAPGGRTIAIGDVHGCSIALATLLDAVAPQPADQLIFLGDYVDRGPDSRGVIDRILTLADQCQVVTLLGNHEEMLLSALGNDNWLPQWLEFGGRATLESYGARLPEELPAAHLEFLSECQDWFETDTHLFFHGNYLPDRPPPDQPTHVLRWISLREVRPEPHCSGKKVIVGHTAQKGGKILDLGHLVCIDTKCYGGSWLTAYDVRQGTIWQADQAGKLRNPEN